METLNQKVIKMVKGYLQELDSYPIPHWNSSELEYYSYSKSTLNDILERLRMDRTSPPLQVVMEYRDMMDKYACKNPEGSFMFSLAYDVTENIIDEIIKLSHRKENYG